MDVQDSNLSDKIRRVSVIVPTYDENEKMIRRAITSILDQRSVDVDIEAVVIDSGSTDAATRAIKNINLPENRHILYKWVEPEGVAAARNQGINLATGDVIGLCDADDYWHKEKLAYQLPTLADGYDIAISHEYYIDGDTTTVMTALPVEEIPQNELHIAHFREQSVRSRTVLARAKCFKVEQFDERFTAREDPHLWTRLFAQFSVGRVKKPLSYKQARKGSLTADIDQEYRMEQMEIQDLVDQFPELQPYEQERRLKADIRYAKRLILDGGRPSEARQLLLNVIPHHYQRKRVAVLLLLSILPKSKIIGKGIRRARWSLRVS